MRLIGQLAEQADPNTAEALVRLQDQWAGEWEREKELAPDAPYFMLKKRGADMLELEQDGFLLYVAKLPTGSLRVGIVRNGDERSMVVRVKGRKALEEFLR